MKLSRQRAGLMPEAAAELKRIRAEWTELKELNLLQSPSNHKKVNKEKENTKNKHKIKSSSKNTVRDNKSRVQPYSMSSEVLVGVVALVDVGREDRALPLRAALKALGATVVTSLKTIVTHLIWSEGGDPSLRKRAKSCAVRVVSPKWVEACALSNDWLNERDYPTVVRASDLPSPHQLLCMLIQTEELNIEQDGSVTKRKRQFLDMSDISSDSSTVKIPSVVESDPETKMSREGTPPLPPSQAGPSGLKRVQTIRVDTPSTDQDDASTAGHETADSSSSGVIEVRDIPLPKSPPKGGADDNPDRYGAKPKIRAPPKQKSRKKRDKISSHRPPPPPPSDSSRDSLGDVEARVNTAPRRALPISISPEPEERAGARRAALEPQPGPSGSQPGPSRSQPGPSRSQPGPSRSQPGPSILEPQPGPSRGRPRRAAPRRRGRSRGAAACYPCLTAPPTRETPNLRRSRRKLFSQHPIDYQDSSDSDDDGANVSATQTRRERQSLARAERQARRFVRAARVRTPRARAIARSRSRSRSRSASPPAPPSTLRSGRVRVPAGEAQPRRLPAPMPSVASEPAPPSPRTPWAAAVPQGVRFEYPTASPARAPTARLTVPVVLPRLDDDRVLTGMSRDERQEAALAVRVLGGKIQARISRRTTHILLGSFHRTSEISGEDCRRRECGPYRTVTALAGAARGCRVVRSQWALDSLQAGRWLHLRPYVTALEHLVEIASAERHAFGLMDEHYGFDVFEGTRVRLASSCERRADIASLLALCGAIVYDENGRVLRNRHLLALRRQFDRCSSEVDLTVGTEAGQVNSLWVFDSIAQARMLSTRRYINK